MSGTRHAEYVSSLQRRINVHLARLIGRGKPREANEATRYILSGGGKRVRSTLLLLSCEAAGTRASAALHAGAAVELLHNFTLVHDDVMDNAPSRRGKATVHVRWDVNTAILVGDILVGLAYEELQKTSSGNRSQIERAFTTCLLEVCRGQALDLELGKRIDVTLPEYQQMIEKKTGNLIATAAQLGGLIGGASSREGAALTRFGALLGRAFQMQDDLLDVTASEKRFGKKIGGDIIEGKKTFLFLTARDRATGRDRRTLINAINPPPGERRGAVDRVRRVTGLYRKYGAMEAAQSRIQRDTAAAMAALAALPPSPARDRLYWYADVLLNRVS
jgi:geranylgeranyl diphosphate synthase, type II